MSPHREAGGLPEEASVNLLAMSTNQSITWGDLLIILGVFVLLFLAINWFPRRRG